MNIDLVHAPLTLFSFFFYFVCLFACLFYDNNSSLFARYSYLVVPHVVAHVHAGLSPGVIMSHRVQALICP